MNKINSKKNNISYKDFRKGDVKHSLSNINKIKKCLGYVPDVSFQDGINQTVKWFKFS